MAEPLVINRAFFLDRDGVINKLVARDGGWYSPRSVDDFVFQDGVVEFALTLRELGFSLIVVTNQPDISRGHLDEHELIEMHRIIRAELGVLDVFVCPHTDDDYCKCRKPLPGLIEIACRKHGIDKKSSYLVGDQERDLVAGRSVGITSLPLRLRPTQNSSSLRNEIVIFKTFPDIIDLIKAHESD